MIYIVTGGPRVGLSQLSIKTRIETKFKAENDNQS